MTSSTSERTCLVTGVAVANSETGQTEFREGESCSGSKMIGRIQAAPLRGGARPSQWQMFTLRRNAFWGNIHI